MKIIICVFSFVSLFGIVNCLECLSNETATVMCSNSNYCVYFEGFVNESHITFQGCNAQLIAGNGSTFCTENRYSLGFEGQKYTLQCCDTDNCNTGIYVPSENNNLTCLSTSATNVVSCASNDPYCIYVSGIYNGEYQKFQGCSNIFADNSGSPVICTENQFTNGSDKDGTYLLQCCDTNFCNNGRNDTDTTTTESSRFPEYTTDATAAQSLPDTSSSVTTPTNPKASPFSFWWILAGSVVLIIFIISIIIFIVLLIKRKKEKRQRLIQFQNEIHQKAENQIIYTQIPKKERQWRMFLDSKNLVIDFNVVLGQGSNATVYKAFQKNSSHFPIILQHQTSRNFFNPNNIVAAKVPTQFDSNQAEEFIREINALIFLKNHDHIISFLGWTMLDDIPVLITELADTTLLTYVQGISKHENLLKPCLQFLWQISYALEYISEKGMIHRDIACRNILIKNKTIAKLGDFGLCCFCDEKTGIFKDSFNQKFPIKWLSLEALNQSIFSEKSDVWAFGILCFEVFSYGSIPYSKMLNSEILEFLQNGERLEKPENAPEYIYELMLNCWRENPKERPNFKEISKGIRIMLENETLKYGYLSLEKAFDNF